MNALALPRPKLRIAVIAGNVRQYEEWLRAQRLSNRDAFYITCAEDLRETQIARYELVGTWWARGDAETLCRLAVMRTARP